MMHHFNAKSMLYYNEIIIAITLITVETPAGEMSRNYFGEFSPQKRLHSNSNYMN